MICLRMWRKGRSDRGFAHGFVGYEVSLQAREVTLGMPAWSSFSFAIILFYHQYLG